MSVLRNVQQHTVIHIVVCTHSGACFHSPEGIIESRDRVIHKCRFISSDWLARWADSDPELTNIDNAVLQCPHGKLLPNKAAGKASCPVCT